MNIKSSILFLILLILLVGVVNATEVSNDTGSTSAVSEKAVQDTQIVSHTDTIKDNPQTDTSPNNKENLTKKIRKNTQPNTNLKKAETTAKNWTDLAQKMSEATEDTTITLDVGSYNTTGPITLDKPYTLTIEGNGQIINGMQKQVFIINSGSTLVLKNITITNAQTTATATGTNANAYAYGGAIHNNGGTLTINNSTLTNNIATATATGTNAQAFAVGGAIYNDGTLTINNFTLTNNIATATATATGEDTYAFALGGAICNDGTLTINNSTLTNNTATASSTSSTTSSTTSSITYAEAYGGAIDNNGETLTITNSTLNNNQANATATATGTARPEYVFATVEGGAIYNVGTLNITHSTLTNNIANATATGGSANAYVIGGAICNQYGTLTIKHTKLTNNQVNATATGYYTKTDTYGGAIYIDQSDNYDITDTTFYNNTPGNFIINETKNIQLVNDDSYISIVNFTIIADGKEIGNGTSVNNLTQFIISDEYRNVEIIINGTDGKTLNNRYMIRGYSTEVHNYTELVEAIEKAQLENFDSYLINLLPGNYNATKTISWEESATKNLIINGNALTLDGKHEHQFIRIGSELNLTLKNITITNYNVTATTIGEDAHTFGGAIYNNEGNLTIIDSTLKNNQATATGENTLADAYGGAIYNSGGTLTITNTTLKNNQATATATGENAEAYARGGAIYNIYGYVTLTESTLENNQATTEIEDTNTNFNSYGGAIYSNGGKLTITHNTLKNNHATAILMGEYVNDCCYGGAIYHNYGEYNITDTTFYGNTPANFIIIGNKIRQEQTDGYFYIGNFTIVADGKEIKNGTGLDELENVTIEENYDNLEIVINGTDEKTINNHYVLKKTILTEVHNYTELVEAIETAQSEEYNKYIINLLDGDYNATKSIILEESATKNLIINGNNITLNGKHEHQFIKIGEGLNLTLNNITITNYTITVQGGAIQNLGNLTIINSTFSKNTAKQGGAIFNGGILMVKDSVFVENQAKGTELTSWGGAIYGADIDIFNSTFINNTAIKSGGAVSGTNVNISISNFIQNSARIGGAIWIEKTLNVSDSYFKQNNATEGGAIYVQGNPNKPFDCEIIANHFEDNNATNETIYFQETGTKTLKDNTYKNTTIGYNDFVLNITSSKTEFLSNESLPLKYNASLVHPDWYDEDILDKLTYEITIENAEKLNVTGLSANIKLKNYKGEYKANVYNDIFQTSNNVTFTVTMPTSISMKVVNNTMGNVIINVDVKDINNESVTSGELNVYDNDKVIGNVQLDGKPKNMTLNVDKGEYTLKLEYKPTATDYYLNTSLTEDVTIVSGTTITLPKISPIYVGESVVLNGTLKDTKGRGLNTNVTVTINNKKERVVVDDGKFQVKVTPTEEGTIKISVEFAGDKYNLKSNLTKTFNVVKINTKITLAPVKNILVGDKFILNITLTDVNDNKLADKLVHVQINDETSIFKTNKNGNIVYTENWKDAGTFILKVSYDGNNRYINSSTTTMFTVKKINTKLALKVSDSKVVNGTTITITTTLTDESNNKLAGQTVTISVGDKTYTLKTDNKGMVTQSYKTTTLGTQKIQATYNGDSQYMPSKMATSINMYKHNATITVDPVNGIIGEKIRLTANILDENGEAVSGGNIVFKLNGKTLRIDGRFDSNASAQKFAVKNGVVSITILADSYLRNTKNLTASYSGSYQSCEAKSSVVTAQIKKRNAQISITAKPATQKQYQVVTLTATVKDITPKAKNTTAVNQDTYVIFKINGKTIRDSKGEALKVKVQNGKATYKYTIPRGMGGIDKNGTNRKYEASCVLVSDTFYPDTRNTTYFTVKRSPITINIGKVTVNKKNQLSISANIRDYKNNLVLGTSQVNIKINGKSYVNPDTRRMENFQVTDGVIKLSKIPVNQNITIKKITIVVGERQAYLGQYNQTTNIVKV